MGNAIESVSYGRRFIGGSKVKYALLSEIPDTHVGADVADCRSQRPSRTQFIIWAIPLFLLLTVAAVMATLFVVEKRFRNNAEVSAYKSTRLYSQSNNNTKVCRTADCIAAAENMISSMDVSADPCEDFYQYACGRYDRQHSISAGMIKQTVLSSIEYIVQQDLRAVLEEETSKEETETETKAKSYYKSCMNRELTNKKSVEYLKKLVADLGGLYLSSNDPTKKLPKTWTIDDLLEKRNKYSLNGLFSVSVDPIDRNYTRYILKIRPGGLGLDQLSYFLTNVETDPEMKAYTKMLSTFSKLIVGFDNVNDSIIMNVVRFEQKLAAIQWFSFFQDGNRVDVKWLQTNAGFIQWLPFLNSAFSISNFKVGSDEQVLLFDSSYMKKLVPLMKSQLSTDTGRQTVQNYVVLSAINDYAPKLGDKFIAAADEFLSTNGDLKDKPEMWKTCLEDTKSAIPLLLGSLYVKSYFNKEAKGKALSTIKNITEEFRQRLEKLKTLLEDNAFLSKLYPNLPVSTNYIENLFVIYRSNLITMANHLNNKTVDTNRWIVTPFTVNALYNRNTNTITVPAGILRPDIFFQGKGVPDVINFAALGTVTGHEITHGFEDLIVEYNKDGSLCLVDQYSGYPGKTFRKYSHDIKLNVDGNQTLEENIADNAGIRLSFKAYKAAQKAGQLNNPTLMGLENLNPDQLFFVSYAQVWCGIITPQALKLDIKVNEHSPGPFRVIGPLSNSPDFSEAFNCKTGSNMNPVKKCEIF